jgi:hypothetical protein
MWSVKKETKVRIEQKPTLWEASNSWHMKDKKSGCQVIDNGTTSMLQALQKRRPKPFTKHGQVSRQTMKQPTTLTKRAGSNNNSLPWDELLTNFPWTMLCVFDSLCINFMRRVVLFISTTIMMMWCSCICTQAGACICVTKPWGLMYLYALVNHSSNRRNRRVSIQSRVGVIYAPDNVCRPHCFAVRFLPWDTQKTLWISSR